MTNPLGFRKMPEGYKLMREDEDQIHWYWMRGDGEQGMFTLDRWWAYHSAVIDKEKREALAEIHAAINA